MKTATVLVLVTFFAIMMNTACALSSPGGLQEHGTCPKVLPDTIGICAELCSGDDSCPEKMKCCSNGCGHDCQPAVFKTADSPVKGGFDTYKHD